MKSTWDMNAYQLRVHQAQQLAQVLREADLNTVEERFVTTAGGDERKLRGIPAIGRGVTGAIPGTSPHAIR